MRDSTSRGPRREPWTDQLEQRPDHSRSHDPTRADTMTEPLHSPPAGSLSTRATGDRPLRRVFVRDLELMASVGVYELEKRYEQRIVVSVDLFVVDDYDGQSDNLSAVLDYSAVVSGIRTIVESGHTNLLETLAERIAQRCLSDHRVMRAVVRLEKPDIVPGCRSVGIEIAREQP
jgi:dihydroneopterin aldolase